MPGQVEEQLAQRDAELERCRQELARTQRMLQGTRAVAAAAEAAKPGQLVLESERVSVETGPQSTIKRAASAGDRPKNLTPLAPRWAVQRHIYVTVKELAFQSVQIRCF